MKIGHLPYRFSFSFYDHPCVLSNRRGGFYLYIMRYTTIFHEEQKNLDISTNEYIVASMVYRLSAYNGSNIPGWCYASKQWFADALNISRIAVHKIINRLIEKGLIEKDENTSYLRSTTLWYDTVEKLNKDSKQSLHTVKKVYTDSKQSLHDDSKQSLHYNNNIDSNKETNIYNTLNNFIQERERVVRELAPKFKDKDIGKAFDTLVDYCQAKNKKYKNYKSALSNWLRNDDRNQFSKLSTKTNNYQSINL